MTLLLVHESKNIRLWPFLGVTFNNVFCASQLTNRTGSHQKLSHFGPGKELVWRTWTDKFEVNSEKY